MCPTSNSGVILEYVVNNRLDTAVGKAYQCLITEPLYRNPYPLISNMFQSVWVENVTQSYSDDKLNAELFSSPPEKFKTIKNEKDKNISFHMYQKNKDIFGS